MQDTLYNFVITSPIGPYGTYIKLSKWAFGPEIAEIPPGPPKIGENSGKIREKFGKKREKKSNFFFNF